MNKTLDKQKIIDDINGHPDTLIAEINNAICNSKPKDTNHYCYNPTKKKNVLSDYLLELLVELIQERKVYIAKSYPIKILYPATETEIRELIEKTSPASLKFFTKETIRREGLVFPF